MDVAVVVTCYIDFTKIVLWLDIRVAFLKLVTKKPLQQLERF